MVCGIVSGTGMCKSVPYLMPYFSTIPVNAICLLVVVLSVFELEVTIYENCGIFLINVVGCMFLVCFVTLHLLLC